MAARLGGRPRRAPTSGRPYKHPPSLKHQPDKRYRKSIRLRGYDYTRAGAYFITICTHHRECLFDDQVLRSVVETQWRLLPIHFTHLQLDEWVVMPNHLHAIVVIADDARRADGNGRGEAFAKSLSPHGAPRLVPARSPTNRDLANASPLQPHPLHPSSLKCLAPTPCALHPSSFIPHPSSLKCLAPTSYCPLPLSRFSRSLPSIAAQLILALPRRFSWLIGNWPIGSLPPAPSPYPLPHHKPMRARGFSRTIPTRMGFEPTEVRFALCCRGACPASLSGV